MVQCPVCGKQFAVDQDILDLHVQFHYGTTEQDPLADDSGDVTCIVCGTGLERLSETEQQRHVNDCLGTLWP